MSTDDDASTSPLTAEMGLWFAEARRRAAGLVVAPRVAEVGAVERIGDGVAVLSGLDTARQDELLDFGEGVLGVAITLTRDRVSCVLLSPWEGVGAGHLVRGTGDVVRVPVGPGLLGRVLDPLGRPLDGGPPPPAEGHEPVDRPAPPVVDRELVTRPLLTGLLVVDAMIPLGRGQRELIIGDRQTGKTAVAVDAIINQKRSDVLCVYCAVGQKSSSVNQVIDAVRRHGAPERCLFVVGAAEGPPGLQWLAPYAACTMAEHFSDRGRDVLLVIDDLSKHAAVYRQMSLLLRRPPGREAYPGDVFHLHARLLERSARLSVERGGGSLTALPIAETQAGNLSAYIPTNLISITDGQICLEPGLFHAGQKPAVNVGLSVSRVGGRTQAPAMRALGVSLRLDYAQFTELEVFTRFGAVLEERAARTIEHGRRLRSVLVQPRYRPLALSRQVALLLALGEGLLDSLALPAVEDVKRLLDERMDAGCPALAARIDAEGTLDEAGRAELLAVLRALVESLGTKS
ncbi:MAG: F0F1 ATP synthase subunit alpha [Alphaproteobacteria bacterium]